LETYQMRDDTYENSARIGSVLVGVVTLVGGVIVGHRHFFVFSWCWCCLQAKA
jgi:hypothetical protein